MGIVENVCEEEMIHFPDSEIVTYLCESQETNDFESAYFGHIFDKFGYW